jgi:signal-transduction protein with cAMP-binding, CBS, and nucleotidyltransferase domain
MWAMVRHLKKVTYTVGDKIYEEGEFSEVLFMINKGTVKLYTYNGYAFAQYTNGEHFGDSEVFAGIDRIG